MIGRKSKEGYLKNCFEFSVQNIFLVTSFVCVFWMSTLRAGMCVRNGNVNFCKGAIDVGVGASGTSSAGSIARGGGYTSGSGPSGGVPGPRWHAEKYIKRFSDSLDYRRFKAMAVDSSSPIIYDSIV